MRVLAVAILSLLSITVYAQEAEDNIPRLLDLATQTIFDDYKTGTIQLNQIERKIRTQRIDLFINELIRVYKLRITLNRYYFHPRLCRQYLEEITSIVEKNQKLLGEHYNIYRAYFESEWAGFYFDINDYEKAFQLYERSLEEYKRQTNTPENCLALFRVSQYMGDIQIIKGESEAAINQYLASVDYYKCSNGKNFPLLFRNVGKTFLSKGDLRNARLYFKLAEDSLKTSWHKFKNKKEPAAAAISLYEALSQFYQKRHEYDSALLSLKQAEKYLKYSVPVLQARVQIGLGQTSEGLGRLDYGQTCYEQAIQLLLQNNDKDIRLSEGYLLLGGIYERKGNFTRALKFYQQAIATLVLNFDPANADNPELNNILSKKSLFQVLQRKYSLLEKLSAQQGDSSILQKAWTTNQLALALIDSTANEVSLDKDKVILAEQSFHAYEDGIRMGIKLFDQTGDDRYFQTCFSMIDKSKGVLLLENLRLVNHFAGVDKQWLDKERDLKSELLSYEGEIFRLTTEGGKPEQLLFFREEYGKAKRDYALLIDSIKKRSPSYYQLRFNHQVMTARDVQQQLLQPGETLIEFFVGDKDLIISGLSQTGRYMNSKNLLPKLNEKINRFRELLTSADSVTAGKEFNTLSSELYDYLLKDVLTHLKNSTHLIIIPDGVLGYIPFEVLREKESGEASYLINSYRVRYAHSASYLNEQIKKRNSESSNFFAGFLATGNKQGSGLIKRSGLAALKYAEKEVHAIVELLNTRSTVFEDATKEDFIKHAANSRVLHLAMHAQVNDEDPMFSTLLFESAGDSTTQESLFAIDLYDMQLNSDMAVLSACETGIGQLHRGEGIMSFSRAFSYAGVPSTVISLWKAPDKSTSLLMINFYRYLKQGLSKDEALQKAKQDFVADYPQMAHPFYWAGFVLMGNNASLSIPPSYDWAWWIAVGLLFVFMIVVVWRLTRAKREPVN